MVRSKGFIYLKYALVFVCCFFAVSHGKKLEAIQKAGIIRVAMINREEKPFVFFDQKGDLSGIDVQLAERIAKSLKVKLKLVRTEKTPDRVVGQVEKGEADIAISNLSITLNRALRVSFSAPYIKVHKAILLNQSIFSEYKKNDLESLSSFFTGKNKLGVMRGSSYLEFAKTLFPNAPLVYYDDWNELVKDLNLGKIAGGFWDQFELEKVLLLEPQGLLKYMVVQLRVPTDKIAIAMPKNDIHLLHWINTYLETEEETLNARDLVVLFMRYGKKS